ncbi:putative phage HD domain protein [Salmonella phage SPFM1]|nr:putative phage HD domain protein [Salmonella phage SPFM1]
MEQLDISYFIQQKFGRNGVSNVPSWYGTLLFAREQGKSKGDAKFHAVGHAADRGIPSVDDVSNYMHRSYLEHRSSHKGNYNGIVSEIVAVLKRKYKLTDDECLTIAHAV